MRVNEIFYSIQGEGVWAGEPTVFIRLQGCNLRCSWCDTFRAQDPEGGEEWGVGSIVRRVHELLPVVSTERLWVCITGGEPLTQKAELAHLVSSLRAWWYRVTIETNGSCPPPSWWRRVNSWSIDCKCPSSGESSSFERSWTDLRERDQIKFVVATPKDLDYVQSILCSKLFTPKVLISPVAMTLVDVPNERATEYWNREWLQEVVEFCKEHRLRMSLQLHKLIWGNKDGV